MGLFLPTARIPVEEMILDAVMNSEMFIGDDEITRLRRGDSDALAAMVARYQHRLFRYLLHLSRDRTTAEDLFQQTWLRVMEKIGRYDTARRFDGWLFAVARNLAIDHFRARRFTESLDEPKDSTSMRGERRPAAGQNALGSLLESERGAMLAECMRELAAIHREVLTLRFEEEMKLAEIADVVRIPISTVKSRLSRALEGLRKHVEKRMAEGAI
jgi:RNA polymerase sigma-70 factor (ECF subfamily)